MMKENETLHLSKTQQLQSASSPEGWYEELKKGLLLGRLVWIQAPQKGCAIHYSKKILNKLGFKNGEIPYLSASEFLFSCRFGFLFHMTMRSRVLLVGEMDRLSEDQYQEMVRYLKKTREFKMLYELGVVIVESRGQQMEEKLKPASPLILQPFADACEPDLNELVQDWVEEASAMFGKRVFRISEDAADLMELILEKEGVDVLKVYIFQSVMSLSGDEICAPNLINVIKNNKLDLAGNRGNFEKMNTF